MPKRQFLNKFLFIIVSAIGGLIGGALVATAINYDIAYVIAVETLSKIFK